MLLHGARSVVVQMNEIHQRSVVDTMCNPRGSSTSADRQVARFGLPWSGL